MKKNGRFILVGLFILAFFNGCNKSDSNESGTLVFKGVKSLPLIKSSSSWSKNLKAGSNTHLMHTVNLKLFVAELWVSQELVASGIPDDFKWYKIGGNNELKLVEEFLFTSNDLPVGEYKSIKIVFKNTIKRIAVYQSDINKTVEMQGSLNEANCGDETNIIQYFSKKGNHSLGSDGKFHLDSGGESVRGFKVKQNEITTVYWKLGGPNSQLTDCTFEWVDVNSNNAWDCGVDNLDNFNCTTEGPMWTFGVDDGEEDPLVLNAVTDIDGNSYNSVKINDQIWMKENLRTTRLNNGTYLMTWEKYRDSLHIVTTPFIGGPPEAPVRSFQNNDDSLYSIYGGLYSKMAVLTGKLCPTGWHVPSDAEWTKLEEFSGTNAGGKLKSDDSKYWASPNSGATDEYEFSAFGGGALMLSNSFSDNGSYTGYGQKAYFWSSTITSDDTWVLKSVAIRVLNSNNSNISREEISNDSHMSVRCIKD